MQTQDQKTKAQIKRETLRPKSTNINTIKWLRTFDDFIFQTPLFYRDPPTLKWHQLFQNSVPTTSELEIVFGIVCMTSTSELEIKSRKVCVPAHYKPKGVNLLTQSRGVIYRGTLNRGVKNIAVQKIKGEVAVLVSLYNLLYQVFIIYYIRQVIERIDIGSPCPKV